MSLYKILMIGKIHSEGKNLLKEKDEIKIIKNLKIFVKRGSRY